MFWLVLLLSLSYLLGSIPFALVISLPQGVDPRKAGSKNPGATNVARLLGKKWGFLTFIGDAGKGALALLLARIFIHKIPYPQEFVYPLVAFFAVLGHLFSIFLKFKGGKGVATTIGTFLFLTPKATLLCLTLFFIAVAVSGYVSAGSLLFTLALPVVLFLFKYPLPYILTSGFLTVLIWIKHRENIKRLLRGEEKSWKKEKS